MPSRWQNKEDYPIEVGIALLPPFEGLDVPRKIRWESKLIRHRPWLENGLWSAGAQRLHQITKDDLLRDGESVEHVAQCMNETLSRCGRVYADSPLDVKWNTQLFNEAGLRPAFEIEHVTQICNEALFIKESILAGIIHGDVRTILDDEGGNLRHRAGPDAARLACAFAASTVRPVDVLPRPPYAASPHASVPIFSC